eukprot:878368_1
MAEDTLIGKLFKKGKINKTWKTRYFIGSRLLQTIRYYQNETDLNESKNEKGQIDLTAICRVELNTSATLDAKLLKHVVFNDKLISDKPHTFHLILAHRTYVLAAQNKAQLIEWLNFLYLCLYSGQVIKSGFLQMKIKSGIQTTFTSRYFVLNSLQHLRSYDNLKLTNCVACIDCKRITQIKADKASSNTTSYAFDIHIDSTKWNLVAKNEQQRTEWMKWIDSMRCDKQNEEADEPLKINKRPKEDSSGFFERPKPSIGDQKHESDSDDEPLKINKRPIHDDSGFFDRPNITKEDTYSKKNAALINKWFESERLTTFCEQCDEDEKALDLDDFSRCWAVNRVAILMASAKHNTQTTFETFFGDNALYSMIALINDYQHIIHKHEVELEEITSFLISEYGLECAHLAKCEYLSRNYRNRARFDEEETKMYKSMDHKTMSIQKQLDKIHSCLLHSFDLNYRLTKREKAQISETKGDDPHDEEDADNDEVDQKQSIQAIQKVMDRKQYRLRDLVGDGGMVNTKFVTNLEVLDQKNERKEDDDDGLLAAEYSFGFPFKYYARFKDAKWFIVRVYDDLKQELLNNPIYSLSLEAFEQQLDAANVYSQCDHLKALTCNHIGIYDTEPQPTDTGLAQGSPITARHILALLFYCNFTDLCTKFSCTFRRIRHDETDEEMKARNGHFFHFSKLLLEVLHLFGTTLRAEEFGKSVFHGVNCVLVFATMNQHVHCPLSTTSQISVAIRFANKGLVLTLERSTDLEHQKYFDCSYVSDFTAESEKLFFGGLLQIANILQIETEYRYRWYCKALNVLTSMVSATPLNANIASKKHKKWYLSMMRKGKEHDKHPKYLQSLWQHAVRSVREIRIDLQLVKGDLMHESNNPRSEHQEPDRFGFQPLQDFLLFGADLDWIHLQRLCELFANLEYIEICRYKIGDKYEEAALINGIRLTQSVIDHLLHYQPPKQLVLSLNKPNGVEIPIDVFMEKCRETQKGKIQKQFVCMGEKRKSYLKTTEIEQSIWISFNDSALHQACIDGEEDTVSRLLSRDDINQPSKYTKMTPLMAACHQGHLKCVQLLLSSDSIDIPINMNTVDRWKRNALINSTRLGFHDIAVTLLKYLSVININECDEEGNSALHYAVTNNDYKVFTAILEHNPDANLQNTYGLTVLNAACLWEYHQIIEELLKYGADPNIAGFDGATPLMNVVAHENTQAIELLVKYGANLDLINDHQTDSFLYNIVKKKSLYNLYNATDTAMHCAITANNRNATLLLLNGGADIRYIDSDGWTYLHHAVKKNGVKVKKNGVFESYLDIVKILYESASKQMDRDALSDFINHRDDAGKTALILLCHGNDPYPCVKFLLETSLCDVNAIDKRGHSALSEVVASFFFTNQLKTVQILLEAGAIAHPTQFEERESLLSQCHEKSMMECLYEHYLQQHGEQSALLFLNHQDNKGRTALHHVCGYKECMIDCLKYLIDVGANLKTLDHDGRSVLHYAAHGPRGYGGHLSFLKIIYDKINDDPNFTWTEGDDNDPKEYAVTKFINHRDNKHETALLLAAPCKEAALFLWKKKGEIDPLSDINKKGTALLSTLEDGSVEIAHILLDAGAKIDTFQKINKESPFHQVAYRIDTEKFDILQRMYYQFLSETDITAATALVNHVDTWQDTVLSRVLSHGGDSNELVVACVEFLLSVGAVINIVNSDGNSPIFVAAAYNRPNALKSIYDHYLEDTNLASATLLVNRRNKEKKTPLFAATNGGCGPNSECIDFLLNTGASIKVFDEKGNSIFHEAALGSSNAPRLSSVVHQTINTIYTRYQKDTNEDEAIALINHRNKSGETALMLAAGVSVRQGVSAIKTLYNLGGRLDILDKVKGRTALHHAVIGGKHNEKTVKMVSALYLNMPNGEMLMNKQDFDQQSALHLACDYNCKDAVEYMVGDDTYIDLNLKNNNNETALMIAAKNGRTDIVKLLLSAGAILVDGGDCEALCLARKKKKECAEVIEEHLKETLSKDEAHKLFEKYTEQYPDTDDDDDCVIM